MKLLIDAGNTSIKWALLEGELQLCEGLLPVGRAAELAAELGSLRDIREIWASNVAGSEVEQHIQKLGVTQTRFIVAEKSQCGVSNRYTNPTQLGSDRWAALIAAWHRVRGKCLVVTCGTATTIDTLSGEGEFIGGLILPGVELMQRNLGGVASQLKMGAGIYHPFPLNTADAIYSGAIQASCGAIERQWKLLDDDKAPVLLSGGAAKAIKPHLGITVSSADNLVIHGLSLISQETGGK